MKNYKKTTSITMFIGFLTILNSCSTIPKNATVVKNFDLSRYLGTWYEIARYDFRFERDLDNTVAQYSLNKRGNVIVLNSGHNYKTGKWRSAKGQAKFRKDKNSAALKVSFFGPFYASYNVIALDSDYKYALIAGKNLDYLWILSREKTMPDQIKENYLKIAQNIGFDTSKLIWVKHDKNNSFVGEK